jgi:drug/metabolite transporter (DMT)-like permease
LSGLFGNKGGGGEGGGGGGDAGKRMPSISPRQFGGGIGIVLMLVAAIWLGSGLVFGSALCYAIYLTGSAHLIARLGTARFAALATLISTAAIFGHFLAVQPVIKLVQPLPVYGYALAMGLFSTALPVFAQSAAIRRLGSARVALVSMLGPLATIGFAGWLLAEPLSLAQLLGAALVITGVALVSRR